MTTNGAVFFLGNKAHYQVLDQPNNGNQDMVNQNIPTIHGNHTITNYGKNDIIDTNRLDQTTSSSSTYTSPTAQSNNETNTLINHTVKNPYFNNPLTKKISYDEETQSYKIQSVCKEAIINIDDDIGFSLGNGVKHRSKKYGVSHSSEFILNDNDDRMDLNPSDLNELDNDINKNKPAKRYRRGFTASALLRALMARRRKRLEPESIADQEPYANLDFMNCSYRDSCRCLECQSRYFECDDDDDDEDDININDYNGENVDSDDLASLSDQASRKSDNDSESECLDLEAGCYEDYLHDTDDDEVFLKPAPITTAGSKDPLIPATKDSNPQPSINETAEENLELELAAGAPVFFDHLLNHPFSCSVQ